VAALALALDRSPVVHHQTTLTLTRPALHDRPFSAEALAATLRSGGTLRRHEGTLTVEVTELKRGREALGDGRVDVHLNADLDAASLSGEATSRGTAAPDLEAKVRTAFDRATRRLSFDVDASLARIEPIAPLLHFSFRGLGTKGLTLSVGLHGALGGLIDGVGADGTVRLDPSPLRRLTGSAAVTIAGTHLQYRDQDRSVASPALSWSGRIDADRDVRELRGALHVGEVHVALGPLRYDAADLRDALSARMQGDPRHGEVEVEERIDLGALRQEVAPAYPTGDLSLSFKASRDRDGLIRVPNLQLENRAAGTSVELRGGLDLGEDRRSFSMTGTLKQDLAKAWRAREEFIGRGALTTDVAVESGDLRRYQTTASLRIKDGHVELARQHFKAEAIDGEVPVVTEFFLGKRGLKSTRDAEPNSYSELRFADQHPRLSRRSYLSIARIETPWATVAPLAGNLVIDHRTLSMSQIELGVREGRVTGRATILWHGLDSTAEVDLRASGVKSSRGEPFDGNVAVEVSLRQRSVQGRAEILRIGSRHLLDLLDVVDPPRADAAINRVRRALSLGYPEHVRLSFNRGFASAKITLGGIAGLLRIDEIRGIPMGPIIDRLVAPLLLVEE
jgi:hypothetical protein